MKWTMVEGALMENGTELGDGVERSVIGGLVTPHVSQTILHPLGSPEEVKDTEIAEHRLCCEYLEKDRVLVS